MKVLIVQTKRGIGDGIIFLPYIVAISKKLKTPVSLLTRASTRSNELVGNNPHINEIIILDRDDKNNYGRHFGFMGALNLIKDLKEKKFDKSYAFNSSFRYAFITKISGIKECHNYTLGKKKNQNIIEAANSFVFKNLGEKVESNPQLFVKEKKIIEAKNKFKMNNETKHILLGVGGSGPTKRVPAEKFIEFINMLNKDKKCMYYLAAGSGNEEQEIVNKIKSSENKNNCIELNKMNLIEILPIIKNCDLAVCNDTSFSHISAALSIKTLVLMTDTPLLYGSYSPNMYPILPEGETHVTHNTLGKEKINSSEIYQKAKKILDI